MKKEWEGSQECGLMGKGSLAKAQPQEPPTYPPTTMAALQTRVVSITLSDYVQVAAGLMPRIINSPPQRTPSSSPPGPRKLHPTVLAKLLVLVPSPAQMAELVSMAKGWVGSRVEVIEQ